MGRRGTAAQAAAADGLPAGGGLGGAHALMVAQATPARQASPDSTDGMLHSGWGQAAPQAAAAAAAPAAAAAARGRKRKQRLDDSGDEDGDSDDDGNNSCSELTAGWLADTCGRGVTPSACTDVAQPPPRGPARRGNRGAAQLAPAWQQRQVGQAHTAAAAAAACEDSGGGAEHKRRRMTQAPAAAAAAVAAPAVAAAAAAAHAPAAAGMGSLHTPTEPNLAGPSDMGEGEGSNWLALPPPAPPPAPAAAAGAAWGAAAAHAGAPADVAGQEQTLHMLQPRAGCLRLQITGQLGKGGFGSVHRVLVRARGQDSLSSALHLADPLHTSLQAILRTSSRSSVRGGGGGGRGGSAQQCAHGRKSSSSSGGSSSTVGMALKVALPFERLSSDMQRNYKTAAAYDANVEQRMRDEFDIMLACAGSPHIVNAFSLGRVWHYGSYRPAILMELCDLGDAERVFIPPIPRWGGAPQPRGVDAKTAQGVVRQAALALRDMHKRSQRIHCDVKLSNLLVFGSREAPRIKLCDFGCAKLRQDKPQFGPASGTRDWSAPEQIGSTAGRLDFCCDSWNLGLLVLALRRGRHPFWWIKQQGRTPAELGSSLADGLGEPHCPYATADASGSALGGTECAFVQRCLAAHSSSRPHAAQLLASDAYLSGRYRGG